jgi:hypothetical protein
MNKLLTIDEVDTVGADIFPAARVRVFPLMRPDDVAAHLGISREEVLTLDIPWSQLGPYQRDRRYSAVDVDAYQAEHYGLPWKMHREILRATGELGFIYFFRCERFVKIGYSKNPKDRLHRLRLATPFELEPIGQVAARHKAEGALQRLLKPYEHRRREWFRLEPDLQQAIEEVCRG